MRKNFISESFVFYFFQNTANAYLNISFRAVKTKLNLGIVYYLLIYKKCRYETLCRFRQLCKASFL